MKRMIFLLALVVSVTSCKKEFDEPPTGTIPEGSLLTIDDLRQMYLGTEVRFNNDETVYCVVTADETSGNLYKNVYVQDATGAINLRLLASGGLYEGDSIRINLNGTVLSEFNGVLQLDSVDVDRNVVKQATEVHVEPTDIDITQISDTYESQLVRFTGVQFASTDTAETYADAINQFSENRILENCNADQTIVRTSGFANFADSPVPDGNGTLVGILGQYQTDYQIYIRDEDDVDFSGSRCQGSSNYLSKDFSSQSITSGGWQNYVVLSTPGSYQWTTSDLGSSGNFYAKASGWNGGGADDTELWMISPAADLTNATNPVLSFMNARNFSGPVIEILVSTDYDGSSDPSVQGTWVDITSLATLDMSTSSFNWTASGNIDMSTYNGQSSVYVAFKYTSTSAAGASTWEIDDILLVEQ